MTLGTLNDSFTETGRYPLRKWEAPPQVDRSWFGVIGAAMREVNPFAPTNISYAFENLIDQFSLATDEEHEFPVWEHIPEGLEYFADRYYDVTSKEEADRVTARLMQSFRDQEVLHNSGWWRFPIILASGMADPLVWAIPAGMYLRGGKAVSRMQLFGGYAAGSVTGYIPYDLMIRQGNPTMTYLDSAFGLAASAVLGGGLGAMFGKLDPSIKAHHEKEVKDVLEHWSVGHKPTNEGARDTNVHWSVGPQADDIGGVPPPEPKSPAPPPKSPEPIPSSQKLPDPLQPQQSGGKSLPSSYKGTEPREYLKNTVDRVKQKEKHLRNLLTRQKNILEKWNVKNPDEVSFDDPVVKQSFLDDMRRYEDQIYNLRKELDQEYKDLAGLHGSELLEDANHIIIRRGGFEYRIERDLFGNDYQVYGMGGVHKIGDPIPDDIQKTIDMEYEGAAHLKTPPEATEVKPVPAEEPKPATVPKKKIEPAPKPKEPETQGIKTTESRPEIKQRKPHEQFAGEYGYRFGEMDTPAEKERILEHRGIISDAIKTGKVIPIEVIEEWFFGVRLLFSDKRIKNFSDLKASGLNKQLKMNRQVFDEFMEMGRRFFEGESIAEQFGG